MHAGPTTACRQAAATAIRSKRRSASRGLLVDRHIDAAAVVPNGDDARRIPHALIGNVVAGYAVNAGRDRKLVPARTLRRGDREGIALVLRRPRDDAAGVIALRAPDAVQEVVPGAGAGRQHQADRRDGNRCSDHCILLNFCARRPNPTSAVYRLPLESTAILWTHLNWPGWRPWRPHWVRTSPVSRLSVTIWPLAPSAMKMNFWPASSDSTRSHTEPFAKVSGVTRNSLT